MTHRIHRNSARKNIYRISIKGHLGNRWSDWFEGFDFAHEPDGTTTLTGEIIDQAALHGLLKKIRDLGMPLLSVNILATDEVDMTDK